MSNDIEIYTDGACSGNQFNKNIGGWGAVLLYKNKKKEIFGGEKNTTNNRMELKACINGLKNVKRKDSKIKLYTDSAYIVNCMNRKWYVKWEANGWKNSKKEPVENKDLWIELLALTRELKVKFIKVKGHSGIKYNEKADDLANIGMEKVSVK